MFRKCVFDQDNIEVDWANNDLDDDSDNINNYTNIDWSVSHNTDTVYLDRVNDPY